MHTGSQRDQQRIIHELRVQMAELKGEPAPAAPPWVRGPSPQPPAGNGGAGVKGGGKGGGTQPPGGALAITFKDVKAFMEKAGLDIASVEAAETAQQAKAAEVKPPTAQTQRWRVENLRKKIGKMDGRVAAIEEQTQALDQEFVELRAAL